MRRLPATSPLIATALAALGAPTAHPLLAIALGSLSASPLKFEWRCELQFSKSAPVKAITVSHDFREILLMAGLALSRARRVYQCDAWYCLLRHNDSFTVDSAGELVPDSSLDDCDSHRLGLYGEEMGVGASLVLLYKFQNLRAFAELGEYLRAHPAGKPFVKKGRSVIVSIPAGRKRPDFVCYSVGKKWRLIEAKGTFTSSISAAMNKAKKQLKGYKLTGCSAEPSIAIGTLFPRTARDVGSRPKSIAKDPPSGNFLLKPRFYTMLRSMYAQAFSFFGLPNVSSAILAKNPIRQECPLLFDLEPVIRADRKFVPLFPIDSRALVVDSRVLNILELLSDHRLSSKGSRHVFEALLSGLASSARANDVPWQDDIFLACGFGVVLMSNDEITRAWGKQEQL